MPFNNPVPQSNRAPCMRCNLAVCVTSTIVKPVALKLRKKRKNLIPRARIQRACRFVGEEQVRVIYDCSGYCNTLLLTAGELGRHVVHL